MRDEDASSRLPAVILSAGHHTMDPGVAYPAGGYRLVLNEHDIVTQVCWYATGMMHTGSTSPEVVIVPPLRLVQKIALVNELSREMEKAGIPHFAVEVHVNAALDIPSARGIEVFHYPMNRLGKNMAREIIRAFERPSWPSRGAKPSSQSVHGTLGWTDDTRCAAVLVELGFLSNKVDRDKLKDPFGRYQLASRLADGLSRASYYMHARTNPDPPGGSWTHGTRTENWDQKHWKSGFADLGLALAGREDGGSNA